MHIKRCMAAVHPSDLQYRALVIRADPSISFLFPKPDGHIPMIPCRSNGPHTIFLARDTNCIVAVLRQNASLPTMAGLSSSRVLHLWTDYSSQTIFCLSSAIHCMWHNIKSLAAYVCVSARDLGPNISKTARDREVRFQWDTNRKLHMADRLVTWPMTARDLERSRSWPRYIWGPLSRKWLEVETRLQ